MKIKTFLFIPFLSIGGVSLVGAARPPVSSMPYAKAGLTQRQAAAHLLDRFAFGARPGDVDRVVSMGLDKWLNRQLSGTLPDTDLNARLQPYDSLSLPADQMAERYPNAGMIRNMAIRDGAMTREDAANAKTDRKAYRQRLTAYAREHGYRPQQELIRQLMAQKVIRAIYSENQLREVLTDFWFNHFNVSLTDNQTRPFLLSYERDAIRPYVTGKFRDMLGATAKHPAMLVYLDNAQSNAPADATTTMQDAMAQMSGPRRIQRRAAKKAAPRPNRRPAQAGKKARRGINENYARELMELHTLGVNGGYTQQDVIQVARALTGWTLIRPGQTIPALQRRPEMALRAGFVRDGQFLFRADTHDAGEKTILGQKFPAGGGIMEGERVLDMLAANPATARHLATQLATRFVSDTPPKSLVDRLSKTYLKTHGDLKAVMRAIADSPEFWSKAALEAKIKSPFELAVSAVRALNGDVRQPRALVQWIARMGQPLYAYQQPTGYPDRAQSWVNTGSLLNRMNFGLQLAARRVSGVYFDLTQLNGGHEPESDEAALKTYAKLLLPERDLTPTLQRLTPAIHDPQFAQKVDSAAPTDSSDDAMTEAPVMQPAKAVRRKGQGRRDLTRRNVRAAPPSRLASVVGVILGSPEFQRH